MHSAAPTRRAALAVIGCAGHLLGRPSEVCLSENGTEHLPVIRTA